MGTRGRNEQAVATGWDVFVHGLARCLAELPSRATLIIAASGNRYVQFHQFDIKLSVELTGNSYLAEPIPEAAAKHLRELGWRAPVLSHEVENWRRALFWPISAKGLEALAHSVAVGLHEALGVTSPDELRASGWSDTNAELDLKALISVMH